MKDCTNVHVRDMLPDYAGDRLSADDRGTVGRHLAECEDCTAELSLVRATRLALATAPSVDVARIVAALPPAPARATPGVISIDSRRSAPGAVRRGWVSPRRIAAIAAALVGAVGLAVVGSDRPGRTNASGSTVAVTSPVAGGRPIVDANGAAAGPSGGVQVASAASELSLGAGVSDLSDESLRALLGDIDNLDDSTLADPAEPLPSVTELDEESGV